MAEAIRDQNFVTVMLFESASNPGVTVNATGDEATGRLYVDVAGGSGTVTSFSFTDGNGFDGTVTDPTTTPALSLAITASGVLKGSAGAIEAAVAGTDYVAPGAVTTSGLTMATARLLGRSTAGTGAIEEISVGTGLSLSGGTLSATGGTGDVVGPASATDNAVARFDGTTGKLIQNSAVTIADTTGDITAGKYNGLTITASTGTLTITNGKTLTQSNTLTYSGTDGSSVNFGAGGTVLYTVSTIPLTVGSTTIASGTSTRILYDNAGVLGEYTLTGTGTVVAMQTAPSFLTSITTPSVLASSNDSGALGASGTAFSDLFLASGAVINFAASNVTLTHSSGILTQNNGELRITSANVGTNADSVPTLSSTSTLTNKTLTSPTIQTTPVWAAGTNTIFTIPSSDDTATGIITNAFNSGYTSSAIGDLVILDSSGTWQKTDANTASIYNGLIGIALEVKASGNALKVLLQGFAYCSTAFPTFTVGGTVYMSETAGAVTQTAPTTTDSATRILGYAVHADKMWFCPSNDWITHT